jgi:hypothetical protein
MHKKHTRLYEVEGTYYSVISSTNSCQNSYRDIFFVITKLNQNMHKAALQEILVEATFDL